MQIKKSIMKSDFYIKLRHLLRKRWSSHNYVKIIGNPDHNILTLLESLEVVDPMIEMQ